MRLFRGKQDRESFQSWSKKGLRSSLAWGFFIHQEVGLDEVPSVHKALYGLKSCQNHRKNISYSVFWDFR
jgi:hypothetical protein